MCIRDRHLKANSPCSSARSAYVVLGRFADSHPVSYTHLRAYETPDQDVIILLLLIRRRQPKSTLSSSSASSDVYKRQAPKSKFSMLSCQISVRSSTLICGRP